MNIKDLRIRVGMTQVKFAEYFGIKLRTLQDWEHGRFSPMPAFVDLMAYKLCNEGLLSMDVGAREIARGDDSSAAASQVGESPEFRRELEKQLWRSELEFRAAQLPHGSCVAWLAPYCDTTQHIAQFLRELGFRIAEILDEEPEPGESFRWVVTTSGIVVYANEPGSDLRGLVCGLKKDKIK